MNQIKNLLTIIFGSSFFLVGIICFFATIKGLQSWLGLGLFSSVTISFFIDYIPILREIISYYGMVEGWGWDKLMSICLLTSPYIVLLFVFLVATGIEYFNKDEVK